MNTVICGPALAKQRLKVLKWPSTTLILLALSGQVLSQDLPKAAEQVSLSDLMNTQFLALPQIDQAENQSLIGLPKVQSGTSLRELIERGLTISPQLRQVRAQQQSSQAQRKIARADLLPSFTLRSAYGPEDSQTVGSAVDNHIYKVNTLRLTQPIYNRSLKNEHSASIQAEVAADLRLRSSQENTVNSVVRATVDLAAARMVLEFSDAQLAQLQNVITYLENRTAAGASSRADLERALTRVYAARQTRLDQQTAYRNSMAELQRLTDLEPAALHLPSLKQFPSIQQDRQELKDMAIAQNADIRALERDVEVQQLRVKSELARYQPVLGLSLEQDSSENVQGTNNRHNDSRALVVLNWAVSLGGKEWYQAEVATAELRQREAKLSDEKQRLLQTLDADLAVLNSSKLRISAAQMEQTSANQVVQAVNEQLRVGRLGSLLEALDAIERDFSARQRLIQALAQTIKAHVQILQRTGQLNEESVIDPDITATAQPEQPS